MYYIIQINEKYLKPQAFNYQQTINILDSGSTRFLKFKNLIRSHLQNNLAIFEKKMI